MRLAFILIRVLTIFLGLRLFIPQIKALLKKDCNMERLRISLALATFLVILDSFTFLSIDFFCLIFGKTKGLFIEILEPYFLIFRAVLLYTIWRFTDIIKT